jgi:hypothetical protein
MRDRFIALWRTAAQALFALLLAWAANHGLHIDPHYSGLVEIAVIGAGAGVWAALTHWLQSAQGTTWWARAARLVGRVLVLGAAAVPSYTLPASPPAVAP